MILSLLSAGLKVSGNDFLGFAVGSNLPSVKPNDPRCDLAHPIKFVSDQNDGFALTLKLLER
jgi:hypothetical protein